MIESSQLQEVFFFFQIEVMLVPTDNLLLTATIARLISVGVGFLAMVETLSHWHTANPAALIKTILFSVGHVSKRQWAEGRLYTVDITAYLLTAYPWSYFALSCSLG